MTLKIYTKTGDQGLTKQVTGKMVPKYDLQIATIGEIDELQSYFGVVIANLSNNCSQLRELIQNLQRTLYLLEGDIVVKRRSKITLKEVKELEQEIDSANFPATSINRIYSTGWLDYSR